jgi:hypothetical protein
MALIKRDSLTPPTRRSEAVPVPALGGDVLVRRLSLVELNETRGEVGGIAFVARLLAVAVVDADGLPLWDAEQWALWGRDHDGDFSSLSEAVLRLNGGDAESAKNG